MGEEVGVGGPEPVLRAAATFSTGGEVRVERIPMGLGLRFGRLCFPSAFDTAPPHLLRIPAVSQGVEHATVERAIA